MPPGRWSFLWPLVLFSAACTVLLVLLLRLAGSPFNAQHGAALTFFALLTYALLIWQEGALANNPTGFVRRFMAGLVIKMLVSFVVLLIMILLLPRPEVLGFAIPFIGLYLAFLGFSTVHTTRLLQKTKQP